MNVYVFKINECLTNMNILKVEAFNVNWNVMNNSIIKLQYLHY